VNYRIHTALHGWCFLRVPYNTFYSPTPACHPPPLKELLFQQLPCFMYQWVFDALQTWPSKNTLNKHLDSLLNGESQLAINFVGKMCSTESVATRTEISAWGPKPTVSCDGKRWFKYDRNWLCVNKSQFVPVIFEPPCTNLSVPQGNIITTEHLSVPQLTFRNEVYL
jgi:hypothetical protein